MKIAMLSWLLLLPTLNASEENSRRLGGCAGPGKRAIECGASKGPGVKITCCADTECGTGITCVASGGGSNCKISDQTKIAIYIGGGIGSNSKLWAEALIDFWKTGKRVPGGSDSLNAGGGVTWAGDASLQYVTLTLNEFEDCTDADFSKLDLFFMPGGSAYEIQDSLGANGKARLTQFLDNGGNYLGICAGGYYAARGYYWKGDDGAPTDNCKNQFCRYEIAGTFSYDTAAQDFTVHEWNGQSYHSNLLAYGPLATVLVEGPIEEIAGPWHIDSNPNHPYDSHLLTTDDVSMPVLRAIYWGGATEKYVYTDSSGGTEHAHFTTDRANNNDLAFPDDSILWSLKSVPTGQGGTIVISSAHLEASLFHKTSLFDNGGMTECQQYNNYVYMTKKMKSELGLTYGEPTYDSDCDLGRSDEVKETAVLFPQGLAYTNAPRISTGGGGGGGGGSGGSGGSGIDFEDGTLGIFQLSGGARRPWVIDQAAACDGTAYGVRAGNPGGVDRVSYLTMEVPDGFTSVSYFYSYPSALDSGDDFHVIVNGVVQKSYETGNGASCTMDAVTVAPYDTLQFKCKSGGNGETCSIDQVQFV